MSPCLFANTHDDIHPEGPPDPLSVLFVVDDSPGMAPAQERLAAAIPRFVRQLRTGKIRDPETGAIERRFDPPWTLRVGVVTADMGSGGYELPGCAEPSFGDDGLLRTEGGGAPGCAASFPAFVELQGGNRPGGDEQEAVAIARVSQAATCLVRQGDEGCQVPQPLEAMLKALTPSRSELRFQEGTRGHGDINRVEGAGSLHDPDDDVFALRGGVLLVVILTGADDGSVGQPDLYNAESRRFRGPLELRSFNHPEAMHPVSRYVAGLRDLSWSVIFAAIAGVPEDLVGERPDSLDFDRILADPRMEARLAPGAPTRLAPACTTPEGAPALPARRVVRVARDLRRLALVGSICADDYGPWLDGVARHVARTFSRTCYPRPLTRSPAGLVACQATELLPVGRACEPERGRDLQRVMDVETPTGLAQRELCLVRQLTREESEAGEIGWVYDDFSPEMRRWCSEDRPQRIHFTPGGVATPNAIVGFECLTYVRDTRGIALSRRDSCYLEDPIRHSERDAFCREATRPASPLYNARLADQVPEGSELFCEPVSLTCQLGCVADDDCLPGEVCVDVDVPAHAERPAWLGVCVDPTCVYGGDL
ncbi:MAG: hypothetical protein AAGH15_09340 [Myxococcota bacterium]